jgi:hypothetical protein
MHLPSGGYYFTEIVSWAKLVFLLLGVAAAWKIFRRTVGDPAKDDMDRLNERYARGFLSFEQYQRQKSDVTSRVKAREASSSRSSEVVEIVNADTSGSAVDATPVPAPSANATDSRVELRGLNKIPC